MTTSPTWEQWDGSGFPSERFGSVVYYYPGKVDIEDPDNLDKLIKEIHEDGIADSKSEARRMLDQVTVVHGQAVRTDGELEFYSGVKDDLFDIITEATWVELRDEDE